MTEQRRLPLCVMAVGLPILFSGPALAQISPFGADPNTALLTDEDWHRLWAATVSLNRAPRAAAGEMRAWTDPASGNSGRVSITRVFASNGMPCHAVKYAISFSERSSPQEYNFNWCRTSGRQWKIAPPE